MGGPLDRIGTVPKAVVAVLGVVVAGVLALGLLAFISGSPSASLGAVALAIIVAVPMVIVYAVARIVRKPTTPAALPGPPAAPSGDEPLHRYDAEGLYNPDDLR